LFFYLIFFCARFFSFFFVGDVAVSPAACENAFRLALALTQSVRDVSELMQREGVVNSCIAYAAVANSVRENTVDNDDEGDAVMTISSGKKDVTTNSRIVLAFAIWRSAVVFGYDINVFPLLFGKLRALSCWRSARVSYFGLHSSCAQIKKKTRRERFLTIYFILKFFNEYLQHGMAGWDLAGRRNRLSRINVCIATRIVLSTARTCPHRGSNICNCLNRIESFNGAAS
jgi:hypothetical protein